LLEEEATPPDKQKQRVMEFLKYLGPDWVELWKEAYQMREQEVDMKKVFEECRRSLRKIHLRSALQELDQQIRDAETEDEKLILSEQKIQFERKLRERE
jgi:hypothetical protein